MSGPDTPAPFFPSQWLGPVMGAVWLAVIEAYFRWPVPGGIMVIMALIIFPLTLHFFRHLWPHPWTTEVTLDLVLLTSVTMATFLTSVLGRQVLAATSVGLLLMTLQGSQTSPIGALQGRITLFIMTVSMWFGWLSLLSLKIFLSWPIGLLIGLAAVLTMMVAGVVWLDGGVPPKKVWRSVWLAGWLGLELFIAIWLLPTSTLVGSVVATTIIMLWAQFCRHLWLQTWQPDRGRRYLTIGSAVIVVVLLTARWI